MTTEPSLSDLPPLMEDEVISVGPLSVAPSEFIATLHGKRLQLTKKEFQLLALLASNPHRLVTRERIASRVWHGVAPGRTIDIHISRLRRHLPEGAIETVIKIGYRFALS